MSLKDKINVTQVPAKEVWNEEKETLESFLTRELKAIDEMVVGRPITERTLDEIKRQMADVLVRADCDPNDYIFICEQDKEDPTTLHMDIQLADIQQKREAAASQGNIVEAYTNFMDACSGLSQASRLLHPLIEQLEGDTRLKTRVMNLLEDSGDITDRAAMVTSELLIKIIDEHEKKQVTVPVSPTPAGPKYEHDCSECIFLGGHSDEKGHYDLYYCNNNVETVIARDGSRPPSYQSGWGVGKRLHEEGEKHPLAEAYRRAQQYKKAN